MAQKLKEKINDYKLSRNACYLIAQNADSRKRAIALAQTYFAIQTRKQELSEVEYNSLSEDLPTPTKSLSTLEKNTKMLDKN